MKLMQYRCPSQKTIEKKETVGETTPRTESTIKKQFILEYNLYNREHLNFHLHFWTTLNFLCICKCIHYCSKDHFYLGFREDWLLVLSQQESPVPSADGTLRLNPERDFNYFGVSNVMYCLKSGRSVHRLLLHFLCKFFLQGIDGLQPGLLKSD